MNDKSLRNKAVILTLLITIFWSLSFIASSQLVNNNVSSEALVFTRFIIGAFCLFIVNFKHIIKIAKIDIIGGIVIGLCILWAMYFQNLSYLTTSVSKVAFISSMSICLVPFLAFIINKSIIKKRHIIGLVLAIISVSFLTLNFNDLSHINIGDFFAFLCAFGFAMQVVTLKSFSSKANAMNLIFVHALVVSIGGLIICLFNHSNITIAFNKDNILSLLYLSIVCMAFCYSIQAWASKYISEVLASILISTQAIFGSMFDIIIFHTHITLQFIIGALIMIMSLFVLLAPNKYLFFLSKQE
ncbi:MAG: DMT family transporter [Bacilli bacterium]|nr:DMT family transporter [Bacilli bacterium]